jgi:hypothetical protein
MQRRVKSVLKVRKSQSKAAGNKRPKMTKKKVTSHPVYNPSGVEAGAEGKSNEDDAGSKLQTKNINFGRRREELDAASILSAFSQSASFNKGQSFVQ